MRTLNFQIVRFEEIDSTNTEAMRQARNGAFEGLVIIASRQTAGKGRAGRTWNSNDGGLYLSLILRPDVDFRQIPLLTLMAANAVSDALKESFGLEPDIKWPNDILVSEKKICGILCETCDSEFGKAVIVGIGVNVSEDALDEELCEIATSIERETGKPADIEEFAKRLLHSIATHYARFTFDATKTVVLADWQARSSYCNGKDISVDTGREVIEGVTRGLHPSGALFVMQTTGKLALITAGDVKHLRPRKNSSDEIAETNRDADSVEL
ncbi:MAG: biotin--[acetyl-CoA-carboxylase] ligase [Pyrinomonadaceae bacterium]